MRKVNSTNFSRAETYMQRYAVVVLITLALVAAMAACRAAEGTPRAAAEDFLDAQYVRIDLQSSLKKTDGLASHKVREELRLTQGLDAPAEENKPRVHYSLLSDRRDGEETAFVYRLTISPVGSEPFTRDVIVTVGKRDDAYRVTNYMEK